VGDIVLGAGKAASIAGRCSVFAKSDMIHAQQKGYEPPEVLRGLCDAVMRNFKGTIAKGKVIDPPVAFIGGVAANDGAVRSLREAFGLDDGQLFIPEYHASIGAVGAALIEADIEAARDEAVLGLDVDRLPATAFPLTEPLSMDRVVLLRDMAKPYAFEDDTEVVDAYMGIDIGSVSTNLVVINDEGEVIKEIYTKTDARPVEVVTKGLSDIHEEIGARINLLGVGTTGSGRELIGELTGADIITDEITAHKTGADFIGRKIGKQCDTIFEIGGQDSKFISLQDGIVVDFAMNEACAAGTGSFLEEQAEKLGISIIGEFAELALGSDAPVRLGERCTVFMERDVMAYQQRGARRDDLVAGLAFSIATNYLNRLVRERHIGDVIFFQGGTAYNDAVAAAFSQILDKDVIVPPHNGVMGALGMALLARERVKRTGEPTTFRGWDLQQVDYTVLDFVCKACSNQCDVRQFTIEGEKTYWGDKCSDRYRKPAKVEKEPVIDDLIAFREEALMAPYEAARARVPESAPTVGFARAMYTYDRLPFWSAFFAELGLRPVLSPESDKQIREAGVALTVAEPCFPIRVAHGHVQWLFGEGVDWVFVPNQVNEETEFEQYNSHACPWGQTLPFVIRTAPGLQPEQERILFPRVRFRDGREGLVRDFADTAAKLGVSKARMRAAFDAAYKAQDDFRGKLLEAGARALERLDVAGELGIILVGRPYNMYDKGINMDIPRKLRKFYGVNVIPLDFLPIRGIDIDPVVPNMFWNYGRKILQAATFVRDRENLHLIYMTNFKCGPDSYIKHYVREASGKPYLTLQFDEHQNDAGAMTRCEAYLDSKGFLRWWSQDAEDEARECREELAGAV
jgi:predicted CoA-substrate-specific enzyme activase